MDATRVAFPPISEKVSPISKRKNALPWLFFIFFCLVFFWLLQSDVGFALGILVSASAVVAALETAYAGMYWCTAAFAALAVVFNPFVHFLAPLDLSITALAMIGFSPMLLLFVCRKTGPYVRALPDGSRWWLPAGRTVLEIVE